MLHDPLVLYQTFALPGSLPDPLVLDGAGGSLGSSWCRSLCGGTSLTRARGSSRVPALLPPTQLCQETAAHSSSPFYFELTTHNLFRHLRETDATCTLSLNKLPVLTGSKGTFYSCRCSSACFHSLSRAECLMLRVLNECISFFTDQQKLNYKKLLQYTRLLLKVRGRKLPFLIEPVRSVPRARRSLDSSQARQQRRALRICSFPYPVVTAVCVPDPHSLRRKEGILLHPEREFYVSFPRRL